jgi:ribosomal protein S18 acetylase RimI-like enzyme
MEDGALSARHAASQRAFYGAITPTMPGGCVLTLGGVQAAIAPAVASRSLFNAVVYEDPEELVAQRDGLEEIYDASRIDAWTVWVRPEDEVVARALEAAGHRLDGRPVLMAAELDALDLGPRGEPVLELDREPSWEDVAAVQDAAYGAPPDRSFVPALGRLYSAPVRGWLTRVDGRPASALVTSVRDEDCYVTFVATPAEFRGQGLARELLRRALRAARDEEGATTTTLEATVLGAQIYGRLGYRSIGRLTMWERRRASAGPQRSSSSAEV